MAQKPLVFSVSDDRDSKVLRVRTEVLLNGSLRISLEPDSSIFLVSSFFLPLSVVPFTF